MNFKMPVSVAQLSMEGQKSLISSKIRGLTNQLFNLNYIMHSRPCCIVNSTNQRIWSKYSVSWFSHKSTL